jgi:DNA invertase Pin-like site-specific DNA recombinase
MHQKKRPGAKGPRSVSPDQAQVVETFLASGKTVAEVAGQYGLEEQTVRAWIRQASDEAVQARTTGLEHPRSVRRAVPDPSFAPEPLDSEMASALAQALEAVARAEVAEAEARAKAAAAEEKAAKTAKALSRAKKKAVEAVARAEAAAEAEMLIRAEISAVYAAAVEAVIRAEVSAAEAVAHAEEVVAHSDALAAQAAAATRAEIAAREEADSAARTEIALAYAPAVEAVVRAEVLAAERIAEAEAAMARAVGQAEAAAAHHAGPARAATTLWSVVTQAERASQSDVGGVDETLKGEAAARAEIAALVSRLKPVEVWVQGCGRTLAEARQAALDQLGVPETDAEFEVLDKGSRWLPGRVRIQARIRAVKNSVSN